MNDDQTEVGKVTSDDDAAESRSSSSVELSDAGEEKKLEIVSDEDSVAKMTEHQMMNRCFTAVYSDLTDTPILIVRNEEGKLDEAGKKLAKVFK